MPAAHAGVAELADARDLKSLGSDTVPVRARSPAPKRAKRLMPFRSLSFRDRGSNPWAGALRKQSCGLFSATGVAAATRSGFAKQKHVEPGQSTARSMGKLFSDANQSCASFSSRPTHWRPPVRNIVASLAWSASRCSLFLPVRRPRLFCRRQRGNANPKKSQNIALFRLGNG